MKRKYLYAILATLLLAVVAFCFFYPDAPQGRVLQQSDIKQGLANGHESQEFEAQTGEKTRWTNSLFSGMPTYQISPTYTANTLLDWLTGLYTLWLPSPSNLLFGMMVGFFIMLLCMKFKWYTAVLGALGWGLSSYFIIIIGAGHIWKFMTLMYIPPTIGGIALLYRGKYLAGSALTALFASLQLMSNHIQMTYYFVFVVIAMMIGWCITAVKAKDMKRWWIATACMAGCGILAIGVNSASLWNTYEYSKETIRGKATELTPEGNAETQSASNIDYITAWSYSPDETFTLLIPNVKGGASIKPNPNPGASNIKSIADTKSIDEAYNSGELSPEIYQFIGQFPQYFGEQPMTNGPVYVGALLLVLAVLALFVAKGPMKWCLLGVSVLAIFLSWGHNFLWLTELFINYLPGYGKFRTPSSILVIVEFTVPLMAVICLREILRDKEFFEKYRYAVYGVFGVAALVCIAGWLSPSLLAGGNGLSAEESEWFATQGLLSDPRGVEIINLISNARLELVSADCLRSLIIIALGFSVLMLYFKKVLKDKRIVAGLIIVISMFDLFSVDKRYMDSDNFTDAEISDDTFEMTAADREILKDKGYYRVIDLDNFDGARSSYFHKTIGGYHAAKLTRYNDLLDRQIRQGNERTLDMLNAKYAIHEGKAIPRPSALGNAWFIDTLSYVNGADAEMAALNNLHPGTSAVADASFRSILGNASPGVPGDTVYLTKYAPNRLDYKYKSSGERVAVFSEIYFPHGWKAQVNGKDVPVGRVDYTLRALRLPAGENVVTFTFQPKSLAVTNSVGVICVACVYLLAALAVVMWILSLTRRKRDDEVTTIKEEP